MKISGVIEERRERRRMNACDGALSKDASFDSAIAIGVLTIVISCV